MEETKKNDAELEKGLVIPIRVEKLTTEEALRAENLSLRMERNALMRERWKREGADFEADSAEILKDSQALRTEIGARLGMAPEKIKIRRNGTVEEGS